MKAEIEALMKEHDLWGPYLNGAGDSSVTEKEGAYVLTFDDMPQLSFFVALSGLCRVPIDSIKVETDEIYGGCETCGYGAGIEYTVTVPSDKVSDD